MSRRRCRPCEQPYTLRDARRVARKLELPAGVTPEILLVGMTVEREHGDITCCDPVLSGRVALAHLRERLDYYPLLEQIEKKGGG